MSKRKGYRAEYNRKPKNVNGQLTLRTTMYKKELWKIIKGLFKVTCPDDWDKDYIKNYLTRYGYIAITDSPIGVIPIWCTLTGFNYINLPTKIIVAAPVINNFEKTIGEDCELLFLEREFNKVYYNYESLVNTTAEQLASASGSLDINIINSRTSYMYEAESQSQADAIKHAYDQATSGEPLVVFRRDELSKSPQGLQLLLGNVKQNFIGDVLCDVRRSIMNEFLTFIGINNANTDKKERLITNEVESNNQELSANISLFKDNLDTCVNKINKIFPEINFNIEMKFDPEKIKTMTNSIIESKGDVGNEVI